MNADKTDYDLLYNPRLVVKDYQAIFDRWEKDSERARARLEGYLDVPYGTTEAEKLDIFPASTEGIGVPWTRSASLSSRRRSSRRGSRSRCRTTLSALRCRSRTS